MLHHVRDLSRIKSGAIENLLGRPVSEASPSASRASPSAISVSMSPEQRKEALEKLDRYFPRSMRKRTPVSEKEERKS